MARVTGSRSEDTTGGSATYDISDVEVRAAAQPINLAAAERLVRIAWAILIAARGRAEFPSDTIREEFDLATL